MQDISSEQGCQTQKDPGPLVNPNINLQATLKKFNLNYQLNIKL